MFVLTNIFTIVRKFQQLRKIDDKAFPRYRTTMKGKALQSLMHNLSF